MVRTKKTRVDGPPRDLSTKESICIVEGSEPQKESNSAEDRRHTEAAEANDDGSRPR